MKMEQCPVVFYVLCGVNPRKAMPFLLLSLKTVLPCRHPAWSNCFSCVSYRPFLSAGSMRTFKLCLRKVTTVNRQVTDLKSNFPVFLISRQSPTGNLLTLNFLIPRMNPAMRVRRGIFLPSKVILLPVSVKGNKSFTLCVRVSSEFQER